MGIVNVTPDSFSCAGETAAHGQAIERGAAMWEAGADIVDVGGESTKPGADPVDPNVEWQRVGPVVQHLAEVGILTSIDTRHASVMAQAVDAGAQIINDVSALEGDPKSLAVAAGSEAAVVLMHMKGMPKTMNDSPVYVDVVEEVHGYLAGRVKVCRAAGIPGDRIAVDPGLGFGKTMTHNYQLLENLGKFARLGGALMVGISRKFSDPRQSQLRIDKSVNLARDAVARGAQILRVHDVAETIDGLRIKDLNASST